MLAGLCGYAVMLAADNEDLRNWTVFQWLSWCHGARDWQGLDSREESSGVHPRRSGTHFINSSLWFSSSNLETYKSYKHSQRTLAQAFSRRQDRKSPLRCSDSRWQARTTSQWYAASSRISFTKSSTMCQQKTYHHECSHGSCQISRMPWKSTGTIGSPGNGCTQDGKVSRCIPSASSMPMALRRFAASGSEKVRRTWYQNWWSSKISALIHSVFAQ